jgi:hypothetical protein
VTDREKNGRILLDRRKPTAGCSASGRRTRYIYLLSENKTDLTNNVFWDALYWIKLYS